MHAPPHMLLITDGLMDAGDVHELHPVLRPWRRRLAWLRKQWASCQPQTALEWYAQCLDYHHPVSQLLASRIQIKGSMRQFWMVTPFKAVLMRDKIKVLPVSISKRVARWLADLVNPLVDPDGIRLYAVGSGLVAASEHVLDARPAAFADICGAYLPDRHPKGMDGGRLMRLVAEIQMLLARVAFRGESLHADIHGLWFWGPASVPDRAATVHWSPVETDDPVLASLTSSKGAKLAIMRAKHVMDRMGLDRKLPRYLLLAGKSKAVLVDTKSWPISFFSGWKPGRLVSLAELCRHAYRYG